MSEESAGDEFNTDLESGRTTQTTSRGRGRNGGRKVTQVTKREYIEPTDSEEEVEKLQLPGVFALSDIEEHSIVRARVYRKDPDEGMLGYIDDPNFSEEAILQRWGGSLYRVDGLNGNGQVKRSVTFRVAGDPIFVSDTFKADWYKRRGIPLPAVGQTGAQAMGPQDMLAFMRQMDTERSKAEDERRAREKAEQREHEERMRKLEMEAEDRRRRDELEREDRRRKDEAERDEKRRREAAEAEERRRKDAADADARNKQHMDMMLSMMKTSSEQALAAVRAQVPANPQNDIMSAVKMVVAIKEAFAGEGGGGGEEDTDPLNLLIKHGHEWLTGLGSAVTGAIREVKGGGAQPAQQQIAAPAHNPQPAALPASPEGLVIPASSPLAGKLQHLVGQITSRGKNPEEILSQVMDNLSATLDGKPAPHQPTAPAATAQPPVATPPVQTVATPTQPPTVSTTPAAPAGPKAQIDVQKTTRGSVRISFT
jgi:hypothetical protein